LKIYRNAKHVGDTIFIDDSEKLGRFFDMLQRLIKTRKEELSEYNGDYNLYLNTSGKPMPLIVVTISNYESFAEAYENEYDDLFISLTRDGMKCGIVFVISVSNYNDIRYRLSQNFNQRIALQINNEDDYLSIFENVGKKRPSKIFGRGLVKVENDQVYEFQTARICDAEQYNAYIKDTIEKVNNLNTTVADNIRLLPERLRISDVKDQLKDFSSIPIGIVKKDLRIYNYNFKRNFINIISSQSLEDAAEFIVYLLREMIELNDCDVKVFDAEKIISSKKTDIKQEYYDLISSLSEKKQKDKICIIVGVDKFVTEINDVNNQFNFNSSLSIAEESGNCNFILVDNASKLKNHEYDPWYKNYISKESGIWVGNGIDSQYLINITQDRRSLVNNCGRSFGYVINQGGATLLKLIEMKENGEEYE